MLSVTKQLIGYFYSSLQTHSKKNYYVKTIIVVKVIIALSIKKACCGEKRGKKYFKKEHRQKCLTQNC